MIRGQSSIIWAGDVPAWCAITTSTTRMRVPAIRGFGPEMLSTISMCGMSVATMLPIVSDRRGRSWSHTRRSAYTNRAVPVMTAGSSRASSATADAKRPGCRRYLRGWQ